MLPDQRELASHAYQRYHDDPVFHVCVDVVTTTLVGHGPLTRPTRELIALVIHTRDVLAEASRNPAVLAEVNRADEFMREKTIDLQLSDERIAEIKREFGIET